MGDRGGSSPFARTKLITKYLLAVVIYYNCYLWDLNKEPRARRSVFAKQKWSVLWTVQREGRTGESPFARTKLKTKLITIKQIFLGQDIDIGT